VGRLLAVSHRLHALRAALIFGQLADRSAQIEALVYGRAELAGGPAAYLVGDQLRQPQLTALRREAFNEAVKFNPPAQHQPWLCHINAGNVPVTELGYAGPIVFDRLALFWAGTRHDFPLIDTAY
jgi:hypothetical protein